MFQILLCILGLGWLASQRPAMALQTPPLPATSEQVALGPYDLRPRPMIPHPPIPEPLPLLPRSVPPLPRVMPAPVVAPSTTIRHGVPVPTGFQQTVKRVIANHEGFRGRAYRCPAGHWTIGYGSQRMPSGRRVRPGDTISRTDAERLLMATVSRYAQAVEERIKHPLNAAQKAALTSFAYNVGVEAFERSSVARHASRGDFATAAKALTRYVYADGQVLPGLVSRRKEEAKLLKSWRVM